MPFGAAWTRHHAYVEIAEIELALARLVIGSQPPEDLPDLATAAMVNGLDSPSLRQLAGTSRRDYQDARDLFLSAVDELGITQPTPDLARWHLVRHWATEMVEGRLSAIKGSRLIWWEAWEHLGRPDSLTAFVGLASEWEDDEVHRSQYEADMLDEARRLLRP